ncbi:MAG: M23 family metallopeptidase [Thiotrichales bacterium]
MKKESIVIESPVKGGWAIFNPPGHPKLAFDLLAVDEKKSPYKKGGILKHLVWTISVEDTYTWSAPVYSPTSGEVVEVWNAEIDRKSICMSLDLVRLMRNKPNSKDGFAAFGGNYVVIKNSRFFVLLCHMKEGSINVNTGDEVKLGQHIGEVGNSGASIQPHLHIQVMENESIFPLFGNLVPFLVEKGERKVGREFSEVRNFSLVNGEHYVFQ